MERPEPGIGSSSSGVSIPHDRWARVYEKFCSLRVTKYFDVFNPLTEEDPVVNNLADDLADIYRDLKAGLSLYERAKPIDAAWEWRVGFLSHWGQHLVGAQRAIHEFLADEDL